MINKSKQIKIFDSDALQNFHKRIFFSIIIFSCFYFLAIFRIADVMMFNISDIDTKLVQVNLDRGKIFDRNGELLSSNITTQSLFVNSKYIKKKREISQKISSIINIDSKTIYEKLNSNKKFVYLKRHISPIEQKKIIDLGEINLRTHSEIKRIYPFQNVASHIVGHVNIDNIGKSGVELGFDQALSNGKNIYLTIDINLQNAVRNELIKTISKFSAESGTVIIMDIKNSEILSLTNYPDFDANNIGKSSLNERLNRALQSNYEMGSTFKPLTIAMGVEYNLIDRHMSFDVSKPIKNTINDWDPCDCSLNIKDIIVKSSNIGTAKIAKKIGKDNQIKFFKKIGFLDPVNIKLMEASMPIGQKYHWGLMETMTIGYGHGFAVTPLHLAVAYSGLLNDGKKFSPKIVLGEEQKYNQVIKKETSKYISSLMRAVIEETEFTGPRVKIEGYDIGGKTGTAELINNFGKYDKNSNRTIFVSALPMSDPKYLILTFVDKPKRIKEENYSITSATVNAPLVKNIILKMINIFNIPKNNDPILNAATAVIHNNINVIN